MQHIIDFAVDKQQLSKTAGYGGLVAGTKGYLLARFSFSGDWSGRRRAAVFTCATGEYPVRIVSGACKVPDEAAACSSFKVHVVGLGNSGEYVLSTSRVTIIQRRF